MFQNLKINKIFTAAMPVIIFIMNLCAVAILWFGVIRISDMCMKLEGNYGCYRIFNNNYCMAVM